MSTEEHGLSYIHVATHEWEDSVYGKVTELLPQDTPALKGKYVVTLGYHEVNLYLNVVTCR